MAPTPTTVVLVDDTEDYRMLTRLHLERDPRFEILGEAEDGQEAIGVVAGQQPDVVILDVNMPVMDGIQALPHLRRASPDSTIVLFSSLHPDQLWTLTLETPPDAVMQKAGSFTGFADKVHQTHATSRHERGNPPHPH